MQIKVFIVWEYFAMCEVILMEIQIMQTFLQTLKNCKEKSIRT